MSNDRPLPKDEGNAPDRETDLSQRLDRLGRTLEERRRTDIERGAKTDGKAQGLTQALRLSTEFVAGVLVGAALGWVFDRLLGTSPWGLIVFLLLGFAAGVFNTLRAAGLMADMGRRMADGKTKDGRQDGRSEN